MFFFVPENVKVLSFTDFNEKVWIPATNMTAPPNAASPIMNRNVLSLSATLYLLK